MFPASPFCFCFAVAAFGATIRLYLKDGTYQMAREYQVLAGSRALLQHRARRVGRDPARTGGSRPHQERGGRARSRRQGRRPRSKSVEDAAMSAEVKEVERIPAQPGAYYVHGDKLEPIKAGRIEDRQQQTPDASERICRRSPWCPANRPWSSTANPRPIARRREAPRVLFPPVRRRALRHHQALAGKKAGRVVENISKSFRSARKWSRLATKYPTFKKQVGDLLFKIWPENDLDPGEYALVQYTEGKVNLQVWDFSVR